MVLHLLRGHATFRYMSVLHLLDEVKQRGGGLTTLSFSLDEIVSWRRGCIPTFRRTGISMDPVVLTIDAWGISSIDRKTPKAVSPYHVFAVNDGEDTSRASLSLKACTPILLFQHESLTLP